jgi:hypothetical protein
MWFYASYILDITLQGLYPCYDYYFDFMLLVGIGHDSHPMGLED